LNPRAWLFAVIINARINLLMVASIVVSSLSRGVPEAGPDMAHENVEEQGAADCEEVHEVCSMVRILERGMVPGPKEERQVLNLAPGRQKKSR
jgi:DNA-directed RNA polymerase specialized sigma24 family protein